MSASKIQLMQILAKLCNILILILRLSKKSYNGKSLATYLFVDLLIKFEVSKANFELSCKVIIIEILANVDIEFT